jgi:hypothetical protein
VLKSNSSKIVIRVIEVKKDLVSSYQLLNIFCHILAKSYTRDEEINTHPRCSVLLRHGNIFDCGDMKGHRSTVYWEQ